MTSVNVYLDTFDESVTPDTNLAWDAAANVITGIDAKATIYVKTTDMKNIFHFGLDSVRVGDADVAGGNDLIFYLNYEDNASAALFSKSAFSGMLTYGLVGGLTSLNGWALEPNDRQVPQDYARYISNTLFGTPHAVDIFNNEGTFCSALYSLANVNINNDHNALMKAIDSNNAGTLVTGSGNSGTDNDGKHYVTNNWLGEDGINVNAKNLGFQILKQLQHGDPIRFTTELSAGNLVKTTTNPSAHSVYKMPFKDGDTVSFKVTIQPNATQVSELIPSGVPPALSNRVYQIEYKLVSDADYVAAANVSSNTGSNNDIATSRYDGITAITAYASLTAAL